MIRYYYPFWYHRPADDDESDSDGEGVVIGLKCRKCKATKTITIGLIQADTNNLTEVRIMRNRSLHEGRVPSRNDAKFALNTVTRIIKSQFFLQT